MIRLVAVAFVLAVATSAQAMSPAPLHQPDGMTTRPARQLPPCYGPVRYEYGAVHGAGQMASACWWYLPGPASRATAGVPHGVKAFALNTTEMLPNRTGRAVGPQAAAVWMMPVVKP